MHAQETTAPVEPTEIQARRACLNAGCACKDARILSYRRAAFFAAIARVRGESANRVLAAEPEWRIGAA